MNAPGHLVGGISGSLEINGIKNDTNRSSIDQSVNRANVTLNCYWIYWTVALIVLFAMESGASVFHYLISLLFSK
jgi:hypothetical protein